MDAHADQHDELLMPFLVPVAYRDVAYYNQSTLDEAYKVEVWASGLTAITEQLITGDKRRMVLKPEPKAVDVPRNSKRPKPDKPRSFEEYW